MPISTNQELIKNLRKQNPILFHMSDMKHWELLPAENVDKYGMRVGKVVCASSKELDRDFYALRCNKNKIGQVDDNIINDSFPCQIEDGQTRVFIFENMKDEYWEHQVSSENFIPIVKEKQDIGFISGEWCAATHIKPLRIEHGTKEEILSKTRAGVYTIVKKDEYQKVRDQLRDPEKNLSILQELVEKGILQQHSSPSKAYRRVIDIEKLNDIISPRANTWGLCLVRAINDVRFKKLTPHQHKRQGRYAAVLLGAYSKKVFDDKNSARKIKNLKSYLLPRYTKGRVDFWCDFLDAFAEQIQHHIPNAKIPYMDVEIPYGKSRSFPSHIPHPYNRKDKISVINIDKLNEIKDKKGNQFDWIHIIDENFKKENPLYKELHSPEEAKKELEFISDIITAYNPNFEAQSIIPSIKSRYNLKGKGITPESQKMYVKFLMNLEEIIRKQDDVDVATIIPETIELLYNAKAEEVRNKLAQKKRQQRKEHTIKENNQRSESPIDIKKIKFFRKGLPDRFL